MSSGQQLAIGSSSLVATLSEEAAPKWFAIQTRGRHEKKVASQLVEKGIETFLPTIKEVHRWSDRKKVVEIPLFPSYTFVRMPSSSTQRLSVLQTDGVVRIVSAGTELAAIDQKQIDDIRTLVGSGATMIMYPFLKTGQRIRVRGGSLDGLEGILVARPRDYTLVISVDAIQRSIAVNIDGYHIEPA
jgi:transcription antitermination factor NusG